MNERIQELAEQAGLEFDDDLSLEPEPIYYTTQKDLKKFAELIVRECLAHGKLTQSQAVVNGSEEYNAGREMGIEVFMNQIKLHFGVEE
jgi:hypothetical protein